MERIRPLVGTLVDTAVPILGVFMKRNSLELKVETSTDSEKVNVTMPWPTSMSNDSSRGGVLSLV